MRPGHERIENLTISLHNDLKMNTDHGFDLAQWR